MNIRNFVSQVNRANSASASGTDLTMTNFDLLPKTVVASGAVQGGGAAGAALTAQLTSITHTAPGTPDYAVQDLVQNTGFGFVTADEGNTVLSVILNLQVRLAEVEARLEAAGIVTAN